VEDTDVLPFGADTAQSFFSVGQTSGAPSDGSAQLERLRAVTWAKPKKADDSAKLEPK